MQNKNLKSGVKKLDMTQDLLVFHFTKPDCLKNFADTDNHFFPKWQYNVDAL